MKIREEVRRMKGVAPRIAASREEQRNRILERVAASLEEHAEEIFTENRKDLAAAEENQVTPAVRKRLRFDRDKLEDVRKGIRLLVSLPDPIHRVTLARELDQGLVLKRETCPIGVIGVIFEARPDALVQISTLCIKSGNCAVLKGGKETANTNRILFRLIHDAAVAEGFPEYCLLQAEQHNEIDELLECDDCVDLLIPRGGAGLIRAVVENSRIPVIETGTGNCHIYVDKDADLDMAMKILINAKTQRIGVCNAAESLVVHRDVLDLFLPMLSKAMEEYNVLLRADDDSRALLPLAEAATEEDFGKEYLALMLSVKTVDSVEEAIAHINRYHTGHSDCIVTRNQEAAEKFLSEIDSACVYVNVSTRFTDGFEFGFGAEIGISTQKLQARGPMGLREITSYKYLISGSGQVRG